MSKSSRPTIIIRDIERIEEMRAVEELQKEVWECSERDVVPLMMFIPTVEVGGILVGAFNEELLVGFAYGFVGVEGGRVIIHSDMLAVRPGYRDHSLGYKLKLAQRERAVSRGVSAMTWTFDPLQSRNAHLNFGKLGVVAGRYLINYYGEGSSSSLHRDIGTDRLWVNWPLTSERVARRLAEGSSGTDISSLSADTPKLVRMEADGTPRAGQLNQDKINPHALIEIPDDFATLQQNLPLAARWREATRAAFREALTAGYLVEEFYRPQEDGRGCGTYLLSHGRSVKDFD